MNRYKKKIIAIALMVMMFAGCIVPFEFGAYAAAGDKWTVTWKSQDGKDVLEEDTDVVDDSPADFGKDDPTKTADKNWSYTFVGWAESPNQEKGVLEENLPKVTKTTTYYAAFSKTSNVTKPAKPSVSHTEGFQKVYLSWPEVKSEYGTVYYQVLDNGSWVDIGTKRTYTADFDPYPGDSNGKAKNGNNAASATARVASYSVRAYIKDPTNGNKALFGDATTINNIEVVHPMYVVVKIKRNTKIYKKSNLTKKSGTAKKGQYYVAFGGFRIKGEKKSVLIKVNGDTRYIRASDISKFKYVYKSTVGKNYYKGKQGYCYTYDQIEKFITDYDKTKRSNSWSKKNFGIYVDTYHQRAYLLKRTSSGWKVATDYKYHDLLASTGRQLSPYGGYRVANTMAKKKTTGTKWWLLFNHIGIHEKLGEKLGKPASGGCIRVPDPASKWFFDNIKKGTGVFIY